MMYLGPSPFNPEDMAKLLIFSFNAAFEKVHFRQ